MRIDFWQGILENGIKDTPSFWLTAFYDPKAFLASLRQTRARTEGIALREIKNEL